MKSLNKKNIVMNIAVVVTLAVTTIAPVVTFAKGGASSTGFSPDTSKSKISYADLTAKFGPVPSFKGKHIVIGAVEKTMTNQYWQLLGDGYNVAAKQYGVKVESQSAQGETDVVGQLAIADTMIQQKLSALLFSPITNTNLNKAATLAKAAGIPTVNVDDALMTNARVFVGNDQYQNGVSAARWIAKAIHGKGQVAVIEGLAGVYATQERTGGFMKTIKKYPGIKVVSEVPGNWSRQTALDDTQTIMQQYPNVKAIYANNDDMALGVVQAVKNAHKIGKIIVIGTDGIPDALASIKEGLLTGTVDSFPEKTGEIGLQVALRLLAGQKIPRVVTTPQALITKSNMKAYGIN